MRFLNLSEWSGLSVDQEKYLLQLRPPGDTMTVLIRRLVEEHNITNAAIIFDDSFGNCSKKARAIIDGLE